MAGDSFISGLPSSTKDNEAACFTRPEYLSRPVNRAQSLDLPYPAKFDSPGIPDNPTLLDIHDGRKKITWLLSRL
jgi:hypothetical protein